MGNGAQSNLDAELPSAIAGSVRSTDPRITAIRKICLLASGFDFRLDNVFTDHNFNAYLGLLEPDGNPALVGAQDSTGFATAGILRIKERIRPTGRR